MKEVFPPIPCRWGPVFLPPDCQESNDNRNVMLHFLSKMGVKDRELQWFPRGQSASICHKAITELLLRGGRVLLRWTNLCYSC